MKIQTFYNMKGIIHGNDPKRICCDKPGKLTIGTVEVKVDVKEGVMPYLFHGVSGDYNATFTTEEGEVYTLEKVAVRRGRIESPSAVAIELMELRVRADKAEAERDALRAEIDRLDHIFDTDSLNFLIR